MFLKRGKMLHTSIRVSEGKFDFCETSCTANVWASEGSEEECCPQDPTGLDRIQLCGFQLGDVEWGLTQVRKLTTHKH